MTILSVDLALFERLVGAPLDANGNPVRDANGIPVNRLIPAPATYPKRRLPSYGVRVPALRTGGDLKRGGSTTNDRPLNPNRDLSRSSSARVPVFPLNIEGREWPDVWPCVTYSWFGMEFNPSTYIFDDPFCGPDPSAPTVDATDRDGNVIASGPKRNLFRAHPDPYDLTYIIRTYAKSLQETAMMVESILRIFPARTGLEITQADGSKRAVDMILDRVENLDRDGQLVPMSQDPAEQRHFSRALVYTIETNLDTTAGPVVREGCDLGTGIEWTEETVRCRLLELADIYNTPLLGDTHYSIP